MKLLFLTFTLDNLCSYPDDEILLSIFKKEKIVPDELMVLCKWRYVPYKSDDTNIQPLNCSFCITQFRLLTVCKSYYSDEAELFKCERIDGDIKDAFSKSDKIILLFARTHEYNYEISNILTVLTSEETSVYAIDILRQAELYQNKLAVYMCHKNGYSYDSLSNILKPPIEFYKTHIRDISKKVSPVINVIQQFYNEIKNKANPNDMVGKVIEIDIWDKHVVVHCVRNESLTDRLWLLLEYNPNLYGYEPMKRRLKLSYFTNANGDFQVNVGDVIIFSPIDKHHPSSLLRKEIISCPIYELP